MKSWTLLFVISAVATIGVLGFDVKEAAKICVKETNVDIQAYIDDVNGKTSNDPVVKCFVECLAKKVGWMAENGDMILEKMVDPPLSKIPRNERAEVQKLLQRCVRIGKDGKDVCETAYIVYKCIDTHMEKKQ